MKWEVFDSAQLDKSIWENDKEKIIEAYKSYSKTLTEIANEHGVSIGAVIKHLKSWGVYEHRSNKSVNRYEMCEDYIIGYTLDGYPFYIDYEIYDVVKDFCWHRDNCGYLRTRIGKRENGKNFYKRMHVYIMEQAGFTKSENIVIDHINGKPNDNRLQNLRLATLSDNMKNIRTPSNNTSGHIGVSYAKRERKWKSYIIVDHVRHNLGTYTDINDAIEARERAEKIYFGEFLRSENDKMNGTIRK